MRTTRIFIQSPEGLFLGLGGLFPGSAGHQFLQIEKWEFDSRWENSNDSIDLFAIFVAQDVILK